MALRKRQVPDPTAVDALSFSNDSTLTAFPPSVTDAASRAGRETIASVLGGMVASRGNALPSRFQRTEIVPRIERYEALTQSMGRWSGVGAGGGRSGGVWDPLVAGAGGADSRQPVEHPLGNRVERVVAVGIHGGSEKKPVPGVAVPPPPDGDGRIPIAPGATDRFPGIGWSCGTRCRRSS